MKRFSKASVAHELMRRADIIQQEHNFDPGNGYAQVEKRRNGLPDSYAAKNRAYAEWNLLRGLLEDWGLWDFVHDEPTAAVRQQAEREAM